MEKNTEIIPLFGDVMIGDLATRQAPSAMDRMAAWAAAFDLWLDSRRSKNTQRAYRKAWEIFLNFVGRQPWEIGKKDVAEWAAGMRSAKLADSTIQQRLAAISSFYQYVCDDYTVIAPDGREVSLHNTNPASASSLRPKVSPYGKAVYLSTEEARALLRAIPQDNVQGLRDYALFLGYLATGRRNTELRTLRWGDIDQSGGEVWYRWSGKGKKDQRYQLPRLVYKAIVDYLKAAGRLEMIQDEDYIFTAISTNARRLPNVSTDNWDPSGQPLSMHAVNDLLKKYARLAGLDAKKIHCHTLRHTAAMLRKEAGDPVEDISLFLAHSGLAITQVYIHTVEGRKDQSWVKVEALLGLATE